MRSSKFLAPSFLVGSAVLFSLGCSSMTSPTVNLPSADVAIVKGASTLGTGAFSPNPFTVSLTGANAGKVTWVNADYSSTYNGTTSTTHHLVSDSLVSGTPLWNSGALGAAKTFSFTFTAAGNIAYHCTIHPSMTGTIIVTP
jgi:plastocyanin